MTPDDVSTVQRSWAELRRRREALLEQLSRCLAEIVRDLPVDLPCAGTRSGMSTRARARWLLASTDELVELLPAPSRLAERARDLGDTWPDPNSAPCFAVDGRAFMLAASACSPTWTASTENAWRQAWLLLSDVLAAETLSPFADGWASRHRVDQ